MESGAKDLPPFPTFFARGKAVARPMVLLERRSIRKARVVVEEGLLKWDDDGGAVPTREPIEVIQRRFPFLTPRGQGGS